ncbi:phosphoethanolamine cytidylyltransferase-like protein [Xylaria sp. CBS 124048]|nr:phosphoethanolamine cytidylyltransferase-like protein [Xylaria sp. CBS 124048]
MNEEEVVLYDERIWLDGCWDFFHHGHAGAMLQARQLGNELYVGVHSDEDILKNKGPTVMNLDERLAAVDACRWVTKSVPDAPYVTELPFIGRYHCRFVVHGDDITSDSNGEDCYRFVKQAGRFKVVKRTPSISTTDLVGRMLLCTKTHFIASLKKMLAGEEGCGSTEERKAEGEGMMNRIRQYATDESGRDPGVDVYFWTPSDSAKSDEEEEENSGTCSQLLKGKGPKPGQRVVYVDGGFDLFSSGHIEFLRQVVLAEGELAKQNGWYEKKAVDERLRKNDGKDYGPVFVVAGVHGDRVINHWKGINYPIMNIYERGLCVLQCRYVNAVIFNAPFTPTKSYLKSLPWGIPDAVYHGPTAFIPLSYDPYTAPKEMGIYRAVPAHKFQHVNAGSIVQRIMRSRDMYEERQRKKGVKAVGESAHREREILEEEQRVKEEERMLRS